MALIQCAECKKEVSDQAESCPHCGFPIKKKQEEKEYSVEIIRDYYGNIDPFYLSQKDPEYVYRFLRDEHKNLSIMFKNIVKINY